MNAESFTFGRNICRLFDMATVELHCRGKFGKFGSHRLSVLSYLFLMIKESGSQSL